MSSWAGSTSSTSLNPMIEAGRKAVMIIRTYGHCITETMPATPWKDFLDLL